MATATASIDPGQLSVEPGTMAVGQLRITNDGPAEERFTFGVVGDDAVWVSVTPFAVPLGPGDEGTARIFFRPPRTPSLRAGPHNVTIRVHADSDRKWELAATVDVDIPAFRQVVVAMGPAESKGGQSANSHLTIDNRGNAVLDATVAGAGPGGDVAVIAHPSSVQVEPGGGTEVQVETRTRRRLVGPRRDRSFTVVVTPGGGDAITVAGSAVEAPIVSLLRLAIAAVAAVLIAAGLIAILSSSSGHPAAGRTVASSAGCPGAGHLAHDANGQIRRTVVQPDNFSFLFLNAGNCLPVRWNPCQAIHYVVNGTAATAAQLDDTRQAVADAAQATGITFVYDGPTTEDPRDRQPYEPALYPGRWAPVLIDWAHLGGGSNLTEVAGGGLPEEASGVDVSGVMFLNLDAHLANNAAVPTGFGSGVTWGRILLHELGHVLGLGHVTSVDEIMHEPVTDQTSPTSAYGFGDVAGLRLLGRSAGCLTTPPVPGAGA